MDININDHDGKDDDDYIIIAADSIGIKVTNREGQWMDEKWNVLNGKGYLDPCSCKYKDKGNP